MGWFMALGPHDARARERLAWKQVHLLLPAGYGVRLLGDFLAKK